MVVKLAENILIFPEVPQTHRNLLSLIDSKIDQGCASEEDFMKRRESLAILGNMDCLEAKDYAQKAKIKWALEGDENTSFFHGSLKKKRRQLAIRGILKHGEWIETPDSVKEEFLVHFRNRFKQHVGLSSTLDLLSSSSLSQVHRDYLELPFSRDEIKRAVWTVVETFFSISHEIPKGCNPSFIALIPKIPNAKFVTDFRPISLIGCQYKIIGKLLANRLSSVIGDCISPVQSAFIKGRYILDGPLILNEILTESRQHHKKLLVLKVFFEKAFDSLRWDFLDKVMEKIGFGTKWRSWISGCLRNARSSILVNGSPTKEFKIFKGLRQGDPLSYFLFILAMKGLHSLTCKAEDLGLFKGASVGRDNMSISHLMYADDVIFFGDWSQANTQHLISMLHCFFLISRLKVNVDKSKILGVGVSDVETSLMARIIGCGVAKLPFNYLGVPVGCNMNRCNNWDVITQSFSSKLSSWKARLLSVGGRLSLIKAVLGNLPTYFVSIYLMPVSIRAKLKSMRSKFFRGPLTLWSRVIRSIYGQSRGVYNEPSHRSKHSTWASIMSSVHRLKDKDIWVGNAPLRIQFTRIYNLESERNCLIANRIPFLLSDWSSALRRPPRGGAKMTQFDALKDVIGSISLTYQRDIWKWSLDATGGYSVASAPTFVDDTMLETDFMATRWNRSIPIKVNVFLWRLHLNKLPSRVNLDRKGVQIDSTLCQTCQLDVETVNHIFFNCELAKDLWSLWLSGGIWIF
nr:putative RNA-directed DNA polymerase, eukaryota, reverse transcriptase zinc-binding domain protein [Tanacetum cinerariifolium]